LWLWSLNENSCRLILTDRRIDREQVKMYNLTFKMSDQKLCEHFSKKGCQLSFEMFTASLLEEIGTTIIDTKTCTLAHPSGKTFARWLKNVGFSKIFPSHNGAMISGELFDLISEEKRPKDMEGVDSLIRHPVRVAVNMAAPLNIDPMITAEK